MLYEYVESLAETRNREVDEVVMEAVEDFWFWLFFTWYRMFKHANSEKEMENMGFHQKMCLKNSEYKHFP